MSRLQNGLWNKNRNLGFWASSVNRDVIAQLKSFRTTSEICLSQKKEKNMGLLAPILPFAREVMCLSIALLPLPLPLFHDLFWKGCEMWCCVAEGGVPAGNADSWWLALVWGALPLLGVGRLLLRASTRNTEAWYRAPAPAESDGEFPADVHRDSTSLIALADLYF